MAPSTTEVSDSTIDNFKDNGIYGYAGSTVNDRGFLLVVSGIVGNRTFHVLFIPNADIIKCRTFQSGAWGNWRGANLSPLT